MFHCQQICHAHISAFKLSNVIALNRLAFFTLRFALHKRQLRLLASPPVAVPHRVSSLRASYPLGQQHGQASATSQSGPWCRYHCLWRTRQSRPPCCFHGCWVGRSPGVLKTSIDGSNTRFSRQIVRCWRPLVGLLPTTVSIFLCLWAPPRQPRGVGPLVDSVIHKVLSTHRDQVALLTVGRLSKSSVQSCCNCIRSWSTAQVYHNVIFLGIYKCPKTANWQ